MADAMGYHKKEKGVVTPDLDQLNANFNPAEQDTMGQAIVNAYHFSPGATAPRIARAITHAMTDPSYDMHATLISPDKTYGVPRYAVRIEHPGEGVYSFVLPVDDFKSLQEMHDARQKAAKDAAPKPVTEKEPNAQAFPGGSTDVGPGFNPGSAPYNPAEHPWLEKFRAPYPAGSSGLVGQRPPVDPNQQRGFNR
jgi:hypothetical protein